jgi:diamine N-acetyltransferase
MNTLKGTQIHLRALELEDLQFLYETENKEAFWQVSNTQTPFSKFTLSKYLDNAHLDIYEAKQLRLVMATNTDDKPVGMIDLFDFDPANKRAGIGILTLETYRKKGFAMEALRLLISYAFQHLNLHQLYAHIASDNANSMDLFEKNNFVIAGVRKDWIFDLPTYKDEVMYQLIRTYED